MAVDGWQTSNGKKLLATTVGVPGKGLMLGTVIPKAQPSVWCQGQSEGVESRLLSLAYVVAFTGGNAQMLLQLELARETDMGLEAVSFFLVRVTPCNCVWATYC